MVRVGYIFYSRGPNKHGGPIKRVTRKIGNFILRAVVQLKELGGKLQVYRYELENCVTDLRMSPSVQTCSIKAPTSTPSEVERSRVCESMSNEQYFNILFFLSK